MFDILYFMKKNVNRKMMNLQLFFKNVLPYGSVCLYQLIQGLAQSFLVRLPMSYIMSVQPDASLSMIGLAAPTATVFGIVLNLVFFIFYQKKLNIKGNENKEN